MPNQAQSEMFSDNIEELQQCLAALPDNEAADVRKRWPSTLQSLVLVIAAELEKNSKSKQTLSAQEQQQALSENITIALSFYFGGRDIYIPTDERLKSAIRNIKIWQEYQGNNIEQLALKFNLTARRIAEIIQEQRAAEMDRRQRKLF